MLQEDSYGAAGPSLIVTGGGTGGHVYPALAIASALTARSQQANAPARLLYVGGRHGLEGDLVRRYGLPFVAVSSGAFLGRGPIAVVRSGLALARGALQAFRIISAHRASGVLATGGYVSSPVVIAAWLARVPAMIYLPDVVPGMAVLHLSRFVKRVAVTSDQTRKYLPANKVIVSGYPVREDLRGDRQESRQRLGLNEDDKVILVLGGSRGARAINLAVMEMLPLVLEKAVVIHASGSDDEPMLAGAAASLQPHLKARYRLSSYLHEELAPAMAAADVAISRAGASVMGEYPHFGLPSILVPYPHAGRHQDHNAHYLVNQGAAVKVDQADLGARSLASIVDAMLCDRPRLDAMKQAARALSRPEAADVIARELLDLCSRT